MFFKIHCILARWSEPLVPATWKAEAGGSLESCSSKPTWATFTVTSQKKKLWILYSYSTSQFKVAQLLHVASGYQTSQAYIIEAFDKE
jgi:hypothetical protein